MMVIRFALVTMIVVGTLVGCGHVTAPVPPDDFGIGMRLQAEKKKEEKAREEQQAREAAAKQQEEGVQVPPDEVTLPEMRPVGSKQ